MQTAMAVMQAAGIEADVWKIEGLDRRDDCEMIAEQARADDRDHVGCVVLSRGAEPDTVERWLRVGAEVPGFVGFAIGRTVWRSEIAHYLDDSLTAAAAAARIATNYRRCIDSYTA
jgi:Uncharacterized protein conserved in bacteria